MDFKKILKGFFALGAVYYTVISVVFLAIGMSLAGDDPTRILIPAQYFRILLFSFIMSLGTQLKSINLYSRVLARVLHAICYVFGFMLFLGLSGLEFTAVVIASLVFFVFYVIEALVASKLFPDKIANEPEAAASGKARASASGKVGAKVGASQKKRESGRKKEEYTSLFSTDSDREKR